MGLGFYFKAVPKIRTSSTRILKGIGAELPTILQAAPFHDWTSVTGDDSRLNASLHPAAEDLEFFLDDGDWLICSAKTSTCGPGYHAYLIGILDQLSQQLSLSWSPVEFDDIGDETEYFQNRSFEALQWQMLVWLRAVASNIGQYEDTTFSLNMPLSFGSIIDSNPGNCVTPLGYFTRQWLARIAQDENELRRVGGDFFPWWNQPCDALFWKRLALVNAWCNLPWTVPQNEDQADSYRMTLIAFDQARELSPELLLPEDEITELEQLLASQCNDPPRSSPRRIGYRRHLMRRSLPGGWLIELPGYYETFDEDEGSITVYWFADRTVRGSSFSIGKEGSQSPPAREVLDDMFAGETEGAEKIFDERNADPPGFGATNLVNENDEEYWQLRGFTARPGGLCMVTICFSSPDDTSWAVQTWRSLKPPVRSPHDS